MFERLKEISKASLSVGLVLYVFGFIAVTSFLSRFGIISFDIVNSRFVIAGLHALLAMVAALVFAMHVYKNFPFENIFSIKNWFSRIKTYLSLFFFIVMASNVLFTFWNLGDYKLPSNNEVYKFKPIFGSVDYFGHLIEKMVLKEGVLSFVVLYTIYFFAYLVVLTAFFFLLTGLAKRMNKTKVEKRGAVLAPKTEEVERMIKPIVRFFMVVSEMLLICFFIILGFGSYLKLKVSLFDFPSFDKPLELSSSLVFAWFYSTVVVTCFFLKITFPKKLSLSPDIFFKEQMSLKNMPFVFQHLLIPILSALIVFGQTIFPRISFAMGGGQPREVTLGVKSRANINLNGKIFLLGESTQYVFLVDSSALGNEVLQLNKNQLNYIRTRTQSNIVICK